MDHKSDIRKKVWDTLSDVARPDSRFHLNFSEFIPDFEGSSAATDKFLDLPEFKSATIVFVTPDNCLEELRRASLEAGKIVLVTTYAIRRGFHLLDPRQIPSSRYEYASTLDGMEKVARPMKLSQVAEENLKVDLMVTGTGAINMEGVRYGKGRGFFDIEWGMLFSLGIVNPETPAAAIVHDCQVLTEYLAPEEFDTICDVIVTPSRVINVTDAKKPSCGILWDKLAGGMLASIPPLQELKVMQSS